MYFTLLIFSTCGILVTADVSGDSDDEGKFIDLLPEEEKNAFIESVARRLIPGVKTRDSRYKSNEEVSDEELNQHSEFVSKILQEESSNLRRDGEINRDSEEKHEVQVSDRDIKPIQFQDDDDKNHIDLTLRGHRRKRNEKEFHNEELIIPVRTVYDEESERPIKSESNITLNKDGYQNVNTKSKEQPDYNSTIEDIQVRGPRHNSRGLKKATTLRPILRDATVIADFEPEESNEYVTIPNETSEDTSTDNEQLETHVSHEVTISAETNDDVELSHKGFTQSIFESQDSEKKENNHSNESMEAVTTPTTATTEITVEVTTTTPTPPTTTTQNVVTESSTVENQSQNTTNKRSKIRHYLRANFNSKNKEEESKSNLNEMKNVNNNYNEVKPTPNISVITSKADVVTEDPIIKLSNENLDSLSNNTNLRTENNNYTSNELDFSLKNKSSVSNADEYFKTNKSFETDVTNIYNETTTEATSTTVKLENNNEVAQERDHDKNTENHTIHVKKIKEYTFDFGKPGKIQDSDIEQSAEDRKLNDSIMFLTTTENTKLRDKMHNVTKEVNSSYTSNNVNNLRSAIVNNVPENVQTNQKTILNSDKILTTTEKFYEITSKNYTNVPNYKIYYSSYIPNKTENSDIGRNSENNLDDGGGKLNEKKLEYEGQKSNLKKIERALRQGFSQKEDKDELEETKPNLFQSSGKIKEYLVYEIPADQIPFVLSKQERKKEPKLKEHSYYVPAHKYSPNTAYKNAHNQLESNEEENYEILENDSERNDDSGENFSPEYSETFSIDNLKQLDGHRIFKFNSKKHTKNIAKLREVQNSNRFGLPILIKKPKVTEIYFNPDEYVDMDYYYVRSRNTEVNNRKKQKPKGHGKKKALQTNDTPFPNSEEQLHPYYSMAKDGVKNHMSAVRKILFQQKRFGFVNNATKPKPSKNETKVKVSYDEYKDYQNHKNDLLQKNDHNNNNEKIHNDDHNNNSDLHHNTDHNHNDDSKNNNEINHNDDHKNNIDLNHNNDHNHNGDHNYNNKHDHNKDYQNQKEIALDFLLRVLNTENDSKGTRYEEILRAREDRKPNKNYKTKVYRQKRMTLTDLIGEIKRRSKAAKNKEQEMTEWKKNAGTIKEILEMTHANDVFPTLEKLREFNLTLMRRKDREETVEVFVNVLKDMIQMENRALNKFDWLGSTVDVLGAIAKLKYMTAPPNREELHPSDIQLIKYVLLLYKSSKSSLEDSLNEKPLLRAKKKKKNALPRNKNRKKQYLTSGLLNRVWLYIRDRNVTHSGKKHRHEDFLQFLDDLQNSLFDLHNALKHIAMVTKYKNQQWFQNLKSLYLKNAGKKEMLELLLHIFTSRILELIEESAVNGVEDGYLSYVKHNQKHAKRTKDDFVFVLKLLDELKKFNNEDDLDLK